MSASRPSGSDRLVTVLVVDDARDNADVMALWLGDRGFRVICQTSGEAALASVASEPPDVALLDIMLPGWTPKRLVDALEASCGLSRSRMLFVTGADSDLADNVIQATRCAGVLYKPVSFTALESAILAVLADQEGIAEAPSSNASRSA